MHVRRLYYTCLLLATMCPMLGVHRAAAMPLDPHSFASLGAFPTTPGTYQINTDTLQFFDPSNKSLFTGVVNEDNIAVFTFGGDTTSGINIIAMGDRPLALLFQGDFIYSGTLDVSGNFAVPGPGAGVGGFGGVGSMGGGSGGGIAGSGGSFGGLGGNSGAVNSVVNPIYGDLATLLQGGSGGGGGDSSVGCVPVPCVGGAGGGGGGGIEVGALGNIVISGFVLAHGGAGGNGDGIDGHESAGGGGGSGGGIFMHGATVTFLDSGGLSAAGGFGGITTDSFGVIIDPVYGSGGGGGGRVLILTSAGGPVSGSVDVRGGGRGGVVSSSPARLGEPGQLGVVTFGQLPRAPFPFQGFFAPVKNPQMVNTVKAGQAIPVKFSLGGDQGLDIFAAGFPASQLVSCTGFSGSEHIEETVNAGGSSLQYDPETEIYTYVWKTAKTWVNTCQTLRLTLTDGSEHEAFFQFIK